MKTRFWIVPIILLLPLLLGACTFARQKINVEGFHEKAEQIVPGKTKAADLSKILGSPPNAVLPLKDGKKVYVYTFGEGKTAGLTLILFNVSKTNLGIDSGAPDFAAGHYRRCPTTLRPVIASSFRGDPKRRLASGRRIPIRRCYAGKDDRPKWWVVTENGSPWLCG